MTWQEQAFSLEPSAANLEGMLRIVFYTDENGTSQVSYDLDGDVQVGRVVGDLFYLAHDLMHQAGIEDIRPSGSR